MNQPPKSFVLVQEDRLLSFATACFEKVGLEAEHAAVVGRLLVNNDLRGVRSHGSRTVDMYCEGFERGAANPRPEIKVLHETPTSTVLDGDGTIGYMPMRRAAEAAISKAKEVGLGIGLVRHIDHYGSAGHYSRMCMEAGCIGFSSQGHRNMGNAAGREQKPQVGFFGNPPISFAIPSGAEPPVVLDAATNILSGYDNLEAAEREALLSKIPAAFFKSMGYTAVASLMGGALTGFTLPETEALIQRWPGASFGGTVLAIDLNAVVPEAKFRAEVDRMVKDVRETYQPMPGYDRALLPGAVEEELFELHRREGIRYGEPEQADLRRVSERLGIPLPWE
ncbi:MAG: Ldh family oxidoreductase [Candidatus Poribacteria bacterium]|nr:Ldh family oxidoreductase [Candidatus Poribacteria bacterium]MDE0505581.1 Ldh family oxidoreductase [Candidatus Poribacteria bacterium]